MAATDMFTQKKALKNVKQGLLYRIPEAMSLPLLRRQSFSRKRTSLKKPPLVGPPQ